MTLISSNHTVPLEGDFNIADAVPDISALHRFGATPSIDHDTVQRRDRLVE